MSTNHLRSHGWACRVALRWLRSLRCALSVAPLPMVRVIGRTSGQQWEHLVALGRVRPTPFPEITTLRPNFKS